MVGPPSSVCWMAVFCASHPERLAMHDPANWVVLILVGGVLSFFGYVVFKSR